ncbi:type II secretion system F family protein [Paenibacillus sp. MSJ-34]|uniref:type II secretion system F family protein n=1 Tax=Paenibacillus sp. MSJ-34 TaxID=2841529 RepID=UPI001C126A58|nr:type II secretion system F family protein [Paenibacillus sp. MSJ-34]MBU5440722.1 type II secretion system F family protein [Paenibacillus sp. MSJ-34]
MENNTLPDYTVYRLSPKQRIVSFAAAAAVLFAIGYLFYQQLAFAVLLACGGALYPRVRQKSLLAKRRAELGFQFKQALYSLASSLAAGRSVENGFREAIQDLQLLYPDMQTDLIREFKVICFRLENGEPIERAIQDFSRRAAIEDITNFADVFTTCKRTGGDLVQVVRRTSAMIGEKLDIQQEISVMIAQKRFESKAVMAAPFLFIAFLNVSAPDFLEPMRGMAGYIVSTVALLALGACYWLIAKIMDIQV